MIQIISSLIFALSLPGIGINAQTDIILKDLAKPRFFGTAANTTFLFADKNYTKIAQTQFSIFTPENEMKWETIEPFPNQFNFTAADKIVKFSESVNGRMHGHTFAWANQLAPWVNSSLSSTQLDRALKNHITTIMRHYKGRMYAWDVVNELISNTPNGTFIFKDNLWYQKMGGLAIPRALEYARAADPGAKLYINEYGTEGINAKSDALYTLVKSLQADKIPLDGIGFQAHFRLGEVSTTIQENLQRFADLGLDVAITELDINIPAGQTNATTLALQAQDYHKVVSACVAVKRCVSIAIWGISDEHSWLPLGNVLPWDAEKSPKPAFFAIADALRGAL